jgi:hypothetical protein
MATTTNFGWETPDDTDLVKDGAAAMRTLGNSIDTSFVDLKGGTTNQVLAKNSNTDLDFKWVVSAGDIEGVTAGVGITGGGTTGTVTITNDMATKIDAKGDLVVGTAADTYDRLAVGGTNGHVLQVDSTAATGMKWAAPTSPNFVGVSVYKGSAQSISNATNTALTFDNENFDTDSFHDNSTNTSRFTIPAGKGGKYLFTGAIDWAAEAAGYRAVILYKNGSSIGYMSQIAGHANGVNNAFSFVANAVATDYFEIFVLQTSGGALNIDSGSTATNAQMTYLGA